MSFEPNEVINGLYGSAYDENGREMTETQEFEATIEFEKKQITIAGQFMQGNKIVSGKGKGSMKQLKITSELQKKILDNPAGKFNYIGKLADPTARGEEAVLFIGISFDKVPIMSWKVGDLVEVDLDFTFDGFKYLNDIA